jgi:hypothetical protein
MGSAVRRRRLEREEEGVARPCSAAELKWRRRRRHAQKCRRRRAGTPAVCAFRGDAHASPGTPPVLRPRARRPDELSCRRLFPSPASAAREATRRPMRCWRGRRRRRRPHRAHLVHPGPPDTPRRAAGRTGRLWPGAAAHVPLLLPAACACFSARRVASALALAHASRPRPPLASPTGTSKGPQPAPELAAPTFHPHPPALPAAASPAPALRLSLSCFCLIRTALLPSTPPRRPAHLSR